MGYLFGIIHGATVIAENTMLAFPVIQEATVDVVPPFVAMVAGFGIFLATRFGSRGGE